MEFASKRLADALILWPAGRIDHATADGFKAALAPFLITCAEGRDCVVIDLGGVEFRDLSKVDIVGVYPNYATAYVAWKAKAQQTVDNAHMRYFIVHLHRLLDPKTDQRGKH